MAKSTIFPGWKWVRTGSSLGSKPAIIAEDFAWMLSPSNLWLSTTQSRNNLEKVSSTEIHNYNFYPLTIKKGVLRYLNYDSFNFDSLFTGDYLIPEQNSKSY